MKLKRYFELLKYDFFCLFTFISSLIIAGFYFFHYFAANNLLLCLVMMAYFFTLSILTLFFQKKGVYIWAFIGANVLVYFNKYYDFTSLILLLLAFQINKKHIIASFTFYIANTILSMQVQHIGAIHTFLHIFISIFIVILYQTKNNRLVLNVKEYDKKDLVSIGNVGLMKAITTFDTSKKVEFSTYAIRCIDNEILMRYGRESVYELDRCAKGALGNYLCRTYHLSREQVSRCIAYKY